MHNLRHPILSWLKNQVDSDLWDLSTRIHRLALQVPAISSEIRKAGLPDMILYFGFAAGDDLLCTVLARELKKRGLKKIWMCTRHPQIFLRNTDISHIVSQASWLYSLNEWKPELVPNLEYSLYAPEKDQGVSPTEHISVIQCRKAGIRGSIELKPHLYLSQEELDQQRWASGCIAIQSSGLEAAFPMRNKQWFPERFQALVSNLVKSHRLVQVGGVSDPLLDGVLDMRGRTSIRESAAILSNCRLYIGTVGMLMHLARAVDCPSVIIYGGRERPEQSGYSCNINICSVEPCSPCWRFNKCDHERVCMEHITVDNVLAGVGQCLQRYPVEQAKSLHLDTALIT